MDSRCVPWKKKKDIINYLKDLNDDGKKERKKKQ